MSTAEPAVAVVGLGAMGLAACRELARRGAKVIGLERHELGHAFGSSHGGTRVIRLAYFEHADYLPLLQRSMDLFVALGEASGEPVLERCGVLVAGSEESVAVSASAASADRHGAGFDEASPQRGLFEPGGGFVRPERTMKALAELAQRDGVELRDGCEVEGWSARDDGIEIAFSDETRLVDRVVVAAGAWSERVLGLPGAPGLPMPLEPARQVQAWISPDDPAMAMPDRLPAWFVDRDEVPPVYGVPIDPLATPGVPGESRTKIAI
ncbi:MAG: FAD-dependent oxidoreductase, partial [Planctomycetota bacterium]